jgi:hypothetical protein
VIHAPSISQVHRSVDSSYNGRSPIGFVEKTLRPASRSAPLTQSAESSASGAFFNELEERGEICLMACDPFVIGDIPDRCIDLVHSNLLQKATPLDLSRST